LHLEAFQEAPRRSLVSHVEAQIRDALVEGRLSPGTRLVTKELADRLGTSITPAREALVRFASLGVLTAEPAASFRVPDLTEERHEELRLIRKRVEGLAAEMAALRMPQADIAALEARVVAYNEMRHSSDFHAALKANKELRFTLYTAAEMPTLLQVIETLWLRAGPGFTYLPKTIGPEAPDHQNYIMLIDAMKRRDCEGASHAINRAIDDGADLVLEALRGRPT
jgi:GntR family colanic acid and biofilm gene transcriptional regulator